MPPLNSGYQGKIVAATVTTNLARTFSSIQWRGTGGGVSTNKQDIRLVSSTPEGQYDGVVQYSLEKSTIDEFHLKGFLVAAATFIKGRCGKYGIEPCS